MNTLKFNLLVLIITCITFASCSSRSKFTSESLNIGMTKEQVMSKFGKPYKSEFTENKETGEVEESLFYRENFNMGNRSITNILTFKGGKFVSLKQGQEVDTPTIITNP